MKKVNILYLPYRRFHFADLTLLLLSRCKFKDFHLTIASMEVHSGLSDHVLNLAVNKYGLDAEIMITKEADRNYLDKIFKSIALGHQFSIKLDEDIFIPTETWDFIFENLDLLNDDKNLLISPALSSGIPTVDYFIKNNLTVEQRENVIREFSKTKFRDIWGCNQYSSLNPIVSAGYNEEAFYNGVRNINHFYKGIHAIRVNFPAQKLLNEYIIKNINKFNEHKDLVLEEVDRPYLCNSVFAIKTDVWKRVVEDKGLYVDNFDEVPLNRYKDNHNKKMLFVTNSFSIHTAYNTLYEVYPDLRPEIDKCEQDLFDKLFEVVKNG